MNAIAKVEQQFGISLNEYGINAAMWSALESSIFVGAKPESILMAVQYCNARKLDVMKKPCHIVPMNVKDSKTGKYDWRDVIMPSITEQRITASRTGSYAGQDAPIFGEMIEMRFGKLNHIVPEFCTATVYRIIHGEKVGFSHTEYFEEACATTKDGDLNAMWTKRKRGQLSKCAEAGALRKAFPEEIGNEYTVEEMQGKTITVGGAESIEHDEAKQQSIPNGYAEFEAENLPKFNSASQYGTEQLLDMHATLDSKNPIHKLFWATHSPNFKQIAQIADKNLAERTHEHSAT